MWLSSTAQQALHAILCIAANRDEGSVRVDEIAEVLDVPRNYLSKTLHLLVRSGVLRSARGPKGGFQLTESPDRLTLARVVSPFEPVAERRCLVGRPHCGGANPCALHRRWEKIASRVDEFFTQTTIATLLRENQGAAAHYRDGIRALRHSNQRVSHGSVA